MKQCRDVTEAQWLVAGRTPWPQLTTFGPSGFEAYGRLRFLPDPQFAGQREADVPMSADRPTEIELTNRALLLLSEFTRTDEWYVCVDVGVVGEDPGIDGARLLEIPNRQYALFSGARNEVGDWIRTAARTTGLGPAFVWPADRRWCFARDVDPHWAGIGAERAAIDALVASSEIDVVRADPEVRPAPYV